MERDKSELTLYRGTYASPLGPITLASDGQALTGLWFEGQRYYPAAQAGGWVEKDLPLFEEARRWLDVYFSGRDPGVPPPLRFTGTAFQNAVWAALTAIPYGETRTYGGVARTLDAQGVRTSPRAVGGAVGRNKLSILVPCHRVLGASGSLTGYAGGLDRQIALLRLEGALREGSFVPRRSVGP